MINDGMGDKTIIVKHKREENNCELKGVHNGKSETMCL